ncbi:MAG TPA: biotin transporter BioY [bacterium]|nr:biotin transporter BioY [bacterium]HOL49812.1 biotin transporter BioY [bacterium]HPO51228.1 biotin transporter BioY [bacterium]
MTYLTKKWNFVWQRYFDWICSATIIEKLVISLVFAFLTGVSAQITIKLPFTPVPITGQVLMVLLTGVFLGRSWAGISQGIYLIGGMTRIPWFAGGTGGLFNILSAPSFGYIVGFIPASLFVGYMVSRRNRVDKISSVICIMLGGVSIIYLFGALWFSLMMKTGFKQTLLLSVIPFVPFDILKAYIAALFTMALVSRPEIK